MPWPFMGHAGGSLEIPPSPNQSPDNTVGIHRFIGGLPGWELYRVYAVTCAGRGWGPGWASGRGYWQVL